MYDRFYNFREEPFRLSPDHHFAYAHKSYAKARAYMAYAFMRAEGFVMVTGRPGTGKTTLVGALVDTLGGEDVHTANLVCTQLQADDLLKLVAYEFGVPPGVVSKGELLQQLAARLQAWHRDARRALLIVDEAQDLSVSAMEELRLLTNIQVKGRPLLQIFLLGQPELRELILRPELEQVHQRIVAACHLQPLEPEEVRAYVLHRLEAVGWQGTPALSDALFPVIHRFSEGIPRRINLICSRLFLHCAVENRQAITLADLRTVIGELQDENLAAGITINDRDFEEPEAPPPAAAPQPAVAPEPQEASPQPAPEPPEPGAASSETEVAPPEPKTEPPVAAAASPEPKPAPKESRAAPESRAHEAPRAAKAPAEPQPRSKASPSPPAAESPTPAAAEKTAQRGSHNAPRTTPRAGREAPSAREPVSPPSPGPRKVRREASALRRHEPAPPIASSDRTESRLQDSGWPIIVILVVSAFIVGWAVSGFHPLV